ncbi:MAG: 30S ribosomal protein S5 [Nitrospiraceae bacterium]
MRVNPDELSLKDKVVFINRVAKVVKGGKRFNFCALVVVGDGHGWVGIGKGKAAEVPAAISKAVEQAKKHLVHIPLKDQTIPHQVHGLFGAEHVLLKPAVAGTGIIAGGAVRAVVELAGAHNIIAKTLGRGNPFNTVRATLDGLCQLRDPEEVTRIRRSAFEKTGASHGERA